MPQRLIEQATFQRLLLRSTILPFAVMAVLTAALAWQISRLIDASRWVDHTDQVVAQAEKTLKLMVDTETGQRGYLVSGKQIFLEPYLRANSTLPPAIDTLQHLVQDNTPQDKRLNSIRALYRQWADNANTEIALRQQRKDYRKAFDTARGKQLMDEIRGQFNTFIAAEEALRQERATSARQNARYILAIILALAIATGGTLAFTARRRLLALSQSYEAAFAASQAQAEQLQQQADVLGRQTAELQASREHLAITLSSIGDAVIATDAQGRITFLNPVAERLTGWRQTEAEGKDIQEVFVIRNEETRRPVESPVDRVLREGAVVGLANHTVLIAKDGAETPIDDTGAPIKNAEGALIGVVLVFHDISERKRNEQALRDSAAKFRLLFASNPQPMWVYDLKTLAFLEVNEAAVAQYGYSHDEFLQMRITDIRPLDEVDRLLRDVEVERPDLQFSGGWQHRRKDGKIIDVEIISHRLEFAGRDAALVVAQDVTERKRLEQQLAQAQKLESVGRLAGGIAHDFNNLLTAILGYTELAEEGSARDSTLYSHLQNVRQAAERAANLTAQLLAFARRQVIEPKIIDLNELLTNIAPLLRRLIPENIELVMLPADNLNFTKVDPNQFEQILVNLVVNARDAMPGGGKITIETHNTVLDEEYVGRHEGVTQGEYVMLAVSDTGTGMDEAIRLHIFEPFFTTKEKGRGTGLGLATCYGIVKQAGGHIWLYSEPGEGATFKIYLPSTAETPATAPPPTPVHDLPRGFETILLVEDEPAVRALAASTLRGQGYVVLEAAHGEEALRSAQAYESKIDLLVTDVVMPQMSGKELADRLRSTRPDMLVLYASGYTENTIVHHGVLAPGIAFLPKPFTPSSLARRVREVLDTRLSEKP